MAVVERGSTFGVWVYDPSQPSRRRWIGTFATREEADQEFEQRQRRASERRDVHWVYSAVNVDGEVIYVGVTSTGIRRAREHSRRADWWAEVVNLKIEHFASREAAEAAEEDAIARLQPRYNVLGCAPNLPDYGAQAGPRSRMAA